MRAHITGTFPRPGGAREAAPRRFLAVANDARTGVYRIRQDAGG